MVQIFLATRYGGFGFRETVSSEPFKKFRGRVEEKYEEVKEREFRVHVERNKTVIKLLRYT